MRAMQQPGWVPIHPRAVRITHWINAFAILLTVGSGWRIYNADPLFDFRFPSEVTLGGWLAGAARADQARLQESQARPRDLRQQRLSRRVLGGPGLQLVQRVLMRLSVVQPREEQA
jgi:hypothetical protein